MVSQESQDKGFTMVEVLITIVLAGLFAIGMSTAISSFTTLNSKTENLTIANSIAESKIEELRNATFIGLPIGGSIVSFTPELPDRLPEPRLAEYTVSDISTSVKRIDLVIEYGDFGETKTLVYSTAIGELGVGQY